jgi:NTP pyrophosphatase (non-canonical NTP hydrolase)
MYYPLQQKAYVNKVRRHFNVTNVEHEITLLAEEEGELSDAIILDNRDDVVDAIGDIMIYCLGLCGMFRWNADEVIKKDVPYIPEEPSSSQGHLPYIVREIGMIAKNYKKSNKFPIDRLNKQSEFQEHIGNLMGYCHNFFSFIKVDEMHVLEDIISRNEGRTHEGYMPGKRESE